MKPRLLISAAVVVVACSKQSSTPPRAALDTPVTIVATDSGFTLPDTLHSGLNHIVYENHGAEIHECHFIKLADGMSTTDYVAEVKKGILFPAGGQDCSGPGLTSPGERLEMWLTLDEGDYLVGCWMADHMETRRPGHVVVHGAPKTAVTPPHEDVIVRMADFRYDIVGTLKSGEQTIRYESMGPSMHETDIVRLADGHTLEDVRAWFKHQRDPLPGVIGGGCLDSHDIRRVMWLRRAFQPGRYVLICDMPMIQDASVEDENAPVVTHADAGMFKELTVE